MILIGIYENGIGKIGFIYDLVYDELYYVVKGFGVFCNDILIFLLEKGIVE